MSTHHTRIKNDPRWKAARAACLERDEQRCARCGKDEEEAGRPLEAHHLEELADNPELAFEVDNLLTLCRECHIEAGREANGLVRNTWIEPDHLTELEVLLGS